MWDQARDSLQGFDRAGGTPRQIQNQRPAPHTANSTAQRGKRSLPGTFTAHALRHAVEQPVAYSHSSFRSYVASGNSGAAGGHDELHFARQANQNFLNWDGIICNHFSRGHGEVKLVQKLRHGGPGEIVAFAASAGIAHRHHGRSEAPRGIDWISDGKIRHQRLNCRRSPISSHPSRRTSSSSSLWPPPAVGTALLAFEAAGVVSPGAASAGAASGSGSAPPSREDSSSNRRPSISRPWVLSCVVSLSVLPSKSSWKFPPVQRSTLNTASSPIRSP